MNAATRSLLIDGPVGPIDVAVDFPVGPVLGVAVVAHPHPLYGGTRDNKVVQTMARAMLAVGLAVWRPNFRGVGQTTGEHDAGQGETDDLLAVIAHAQSDPQVPPEARSRLVLAGFSFGSFVQSRVLARLPETVRASLPLVLVGVAAQRFSVEPVGADALVIHGEVDDVVPLSAVLDWARPFDLPVVVLPGADHFFHRRLTLLKRLIIDYLLAWRARSGLPAADLNDASVE